MTAGAPPCGGCEEVADEIARRLLAHGVVVHRYAAKTTDSVYLKLDWGRACSIRVSDHTGYRKLEYRFNVGFDEKAFRVDASGKHPRRFYPPAMVDDLVADVLALRDERVMRAGGPDAYAEWVDAKRLEMAELKRQRALPRFYIHRSTEELSLAPDGSLEARSVRESL